MTRPAGSQPIWASDPSYPAGSDPWSATPTKVDPGSGATAAGAVPSNLLPAQHVNWLLNQLSIWTTYQDRIELQNFTPYYQDIGPVDEIRIARSVNVIEWSQALGRLFLAGTDANDDEVPVVLVSTSGETNTWQDTSAPIRWTPDGNAQTYLISIRPNGQILGLNTKVDTWTKVAFRSPAGTWSASANNPADHVWRCACPFLGSWLVGGYDLLINFPQLYSVSPTDVWQNQILSGSAGAGVRIFAIVAGGGIAVAVSNGDGLWWSTSIAGGTWTHVPNSTFASTPTGIVWVEKESLFWIVCADGEVYTSPDADSWMQVSDVASRGNPVFTFAGVSGEIGGIAALGGAVLADVVADSPDASGGVGLLAIGWDAGTRWELVRPPVEANSPDDVPAKVIVELDDRLALVSENPASGGVSISYTMRV